MREFKTALTMDDEDEHPHDRDEHEPRAVEKS
jgi:hypothetical protein